MNYKLNINYLINNVIYTIDTHFKNKEATTKLINYLYIITTGMIINYGSDYINDIYDTILSTNYSTISNKNTISNVLKYTNPINNNYLERSYNTKNNFEYTIYFKEIESSPIKTLEYLTYQLNYILFNKHKKISLKDNIKLRFSNINSNLILSSNKESNILENVFNVIQSEEIIKIILNFNSSSIKNKQFIDTIIQFKNIDRNTYQIEGLDLLANLFKPLYKIEKTKNIINSYNNIELIKDELDKVLGKNTYKNTYNELLTINNLLINNTEKYYELSVYYTNIRNNVINKYIKENYI